MQDILTNEKSDREILVTLLDDLQLIKKKLGIEEKRFTKISDYQETILRYEAFAKDELGINPGTIKNHTGSLKKFLKFCNGEISEKGVKEYLNSVTEENQSTHLKALRRFIRDYLKLGNWINDIQFKTQKTRLKTQKLPSNEELTVFFDEIQNIQIQCVFLLCFNSGLRINEVLKIELDKIDDSLNCVDVSEIHEGDTKSSWYGFYTYQTADILMKYINDNYICGQVFSVTYDQVYSEFKRVSKVTEISLTPKSLRMIFVERCIDAKMDKNVIDIFEGRIPKGVQSKIYRNYSPDRLKEHYNSVEDLLIL